jgi:hypothetical protein
MSPTSVLIGAVLISPFIAASRLVAGIITAIFVSVETLWKLPNDAYESARIIKEEQIRESLEDVE